ncbi:hypothetical protein FOA32_001359 [Streptococcus sinensis]|nr:hypothetical protein [Streptococcus sinensis]
MNSIPQNIRYLPHTLDTRYPRCQNLAYHPMVSTSVAFICPGTKSQKPLL